jgi:CheY-like chemotaxis protein
MPILIVDDSGEDAALASRVLDQCKVLNPVHLMKTGEECISYFEQTASHTAGTLPCLVLLDLAMNPTSGLEVLRRLRQSENASDSTFVMLSGISDFNIIRQGYQLGATTFLIKPLRTEDVVQMMQAVRGIVATRMPEGYIISPASTVRGSGSVALASNSRSLSA